MGEIIFRLKHAAAVLLKFIKNLIWPPSCILCRSFSENIICESCKGKCCRGYSLPVVPSCEKIYVVGSYAGLYRDAVCRFKFDGELWIGEAIAHLMHDMAERAEIYRDVDIITYVPVSDTRLRERGFDQSGYFANILSKKSGILCVKLLTRVSQGKNQSKSGRAERIMQSKDRFAFCGEKLFSGITCRGILLVDDVITTGATMEECAEILSKNCQCPIYGCAAATGRQDI